MNIEKQKLECEMTEMLKIIGQAKEIYANDITDHTENEYICEGLLDASYRKQSEGEWYKIKDFPRHHFCNQCGKGNRTKANFCPNCGAKMKGGE